MGFVIQESATEVLSRNQAGTERKLAVADIAERQKLPTSLMPPGLMNQMTVKDFASLLDYLEQLAKEAAVKTTKQTPMTDLGKLHYDWKNGLMTDEQYAAAVKSLEVSGGGDLGLVPVYGYYTDPVTGKKTEGIIQTSKSGNAVAPKLPPNFTPVKPAEFLNQGTQFAPTSPTTGDARGPAIPIDIQGRALRDKLGEAEATRVINLPKGEAQASGLTTSLKELRDHPGLPEIVGGYGIGGFTPISKDVLPPMPGSKGADALSRWNQLKGKSFLEAFESLKGGGQITQIEGDKATAAINRLERPMSVPQIQAAIDEMLAIVQKGRERARQGLLVTLDGREYRAGEPPPIDPRTGVPSGWKPPAGVTIERID